MEEEECECEEGAPAWMATFSDMATLLLTFFVLLLSFANMDVVQFRAMMGSVREAFGVQHETHGDFAAQSSSPVTIAEGGASASVALELQQTLQRVRESLERQGLEGTVEAAETERGVVLRIREAVLFESGSADLRDDATEVLVRVGAVAAEVSETLMIEGHTDDRPIATARFPSNWELSAARASAVLRTLEDAEDAPPHMSIAGYADTRPLAPNDDDDGRAQNRRVEFLLVQQRDAAEDTGSDTGSDSDTDTDTDTGTDTVSDTGTDSGTDTDTDTGTGTGTDREPSRSPT